VPESDKKQGSTKDFNKAYPYLTNMKLILGHIDDRFAPDMTVTLKDKLGNVINSRRGYSPYEFIANDAAVNAVEMLKELDAIPKEGVELVVQKGSREFFPPNVSKYITDQIREYLVGLNSQ
jgi:hypothetical protein